MLTEAKVKKVRFQMAKQMKSLHPKKGYSFYNLQGRIDYQNRMVTIDLQGNITYSARFTATFQAPDFNFKRFPFDEQNFYLIVNSFLPEHLIQFTPIT